MELISNLIGTLSSKTISLKIPPIAMMASRSTHRRFGWIALMGLLIIWIGSILSLGISQSLLDIVNKIHPPLLVICALAIMIEIGSPRLGFQRGSRWTISWWTAAAFLGILFTVAIAVMALRIWRSSWPGLDLISVRTYEIAVSAHIFLGFSLIWMGRIALKRRSFMDRSQLT